MLGVTVICELITAEVLLVALKDGKLPLPDAVIPVAVLLFAQV
jgi:hypothetical protein